MNLNAQLQFRPVDRDNLIKMLDFIGTEHTDRFDQLMVLALRLRYTANGCANESERYSRSFILGVLGRVNGVVATLNQKKSYGFKLYVEDLEAGVPDWQDIGDAELFRRLAMTLQHCKSLIKEELGENDLLVDMHVTSNLRLLEACLTVGVM